MEQTEIDQYLKFHEDIDKIVNAQLKIALKNQPSYTFQSAAINELATALSNAQGAYKELKFNRRNPVNLNEYADIEAIHRATRSALKDNGLSTTQLPNSSEDGTTLLTRLLHASGQFVECRSRITLVSGETKLFVSQLNEYKKQHLMAILGIAAINDPDDDDCVAEDDIKRHTQSKGTDKSYLCGIETEEEYIRINKQQLDELDYALGGDDMTDIYNDILRSMKITVLADLPQKHFRRTIDRIREIKNARAKLK